MTKQKTFFSGIKLKNMSLRLYLIIMVVATCLCWLAFAFAVNTVNPEITNWLGFLMFYFSLFFSLIGTLAISGFIIRFIGLRHEFIAHSVKTAFRQAILFSFFIIAILFMLGHNLFTWLNLVFLIIGLSVLEFFLLSYSRSKLEINNSGEDTNIN